MDKMRAHRPVSRNTQCNLRYFTRQVRLRCELPGMDGIAVCKTVRKKHAVPIIMLTARVDEPDILLGLEMGADDYICKPFNPREVVARVKTVLRRSRTGHLRNRMEIGPFRLDLDSFDFSIDGNPLPLTPTEYGIIKALMAKPGITITRQEMVEKVQGYKFEGYNRTVDTHVKNLRKKIESKIPDAGPIVSVYGSGYKYCMEKHHC